MYAIKLSAAWLAISLCLFILLMVPVAEAQVPETIAYQGYLTDGDDDPVDDADATLTFRLWSASGELGNGLAPLWTETQTNVAVSNGVFSVMLGSIESLQSVAFDQPLWLSIAVGDVNAEELEPRIALASTPYSLRARSVSEGAVTGTGVADGHLVRSLNGLTDAVTLEAGENVTLAADGNALTITADAGEFALPFSDTVDASAANAFEVRNTGSRAAANFVVDNISNFNPAILASHNGIGTAIFARTFGSGSAGVFRIDNNNNTSPAVDAVSSSFQAGSVALVANHSGNQPDADIARFQNEGTSVARIDKNGVGFFNGGTQNSGADVAEAFAVEGATGEYEPGDVLVISTHGNRRVTRTSEPYSTLVVGVYATKPGVLLTERGIDEDLGDTVPMGVLGVIRTKVSAENGPIRRGDLLVTSSRAGHAMRGTDRARMLGAVVGKALENFDGPGPGLIDVMVNAK